MNESTAALIAAEEEVSISPQVRAELDEIRDAYFTLCDTVQKKAPAVDGSRLLQDALEEQGVNANALAALPFWAEELRDMGFRVSGHPFEAMIDVFAPADSEPEPEPPRVSLTARLLGHDGPVVIPEEIRATVEGLQTRLFRMADAARDAAAAGHVYLTDALEELGLDANRIITLSDRAAVASAVK
jgi:hypothetical protein